MKKLAIILASLFLALMPFSASAESIRTGKYKYMPAFEDETEETYYYSDEYFKESGKIDNEHLLSMSYNLALSTFEIRNSSYSKNLLEEIGFKGFKAYDMEEKPTLDTIGTVIAYKEVDGKNIIAVAIRGEKYDSEWGNNFIVGKSGNAKGFNDTSNKTIDRIKDYIEENNLENNKIWMVGYSRAGTISDLVGVYINNNLNEFKTTADDLYIYTFEAPAASIDNTIYDNIYTVRSINDLIPFVYPKEWGFYTNGKIINIGEAKSITTYAGLEEQEEYSVIAMQQFYGEFFSWLTSRLDRETYVEYLEEPVSKIFDIYFSKSSEDREKLNNFFLEDVKSELLDNKDNFGKVKGKAWSLLGHKSDYLYQALVDDIIEIMNGVRNTPNGSVLTDDEYNTIINSIYPVLKTLGPIIVDDTNYYDGIDYDEFYAKEVEDYLLTDEEMGAKYGKVNGFSNGYDAGFENLEKSSAPDITESEYGPAYLEAYQNNYTNSYLEAYEMGTLHRNDLSEKGKYEANKYGAYNIGYFDGNQGNVFVPYNPYFHPEDYDFTTEEFINGYNEEYERQYTLGYEAGKNDPRKEEEVPEAKPLYHLATLFKNASIIMKMHHPQENLKLIHDQDSYYKTKLTPISSETGSTGEIDNPPTGDVAGFYVLILSISTLGFIGSRFLLEKIV